MRTDFFNVREYDVLRAKSAILYYLLNKGNSKKELERKKDILQRCLQFDSEDEAFQAIQRSIYDNGVVISRDILLDNELIDFDFTEFVQDMETVPTYSDVKDYYIPEWAETSRIFEFLSKTNEMSQSKKEVTRSDVVSMMNQYSIKLSQLFVKSDDMSPEAVMSRLALRESVAISGIREIDAEIKGFSLGNLLAIGGYAGHGKTTLMCSMCYRNAIEDPELEQVYVTLEVPKDEIYMWFVARHSAHPKWESVPGVKALSRQRLTKVTDLTDAERKLVSDIANDLYDSGEYGKIHFLTNKDFPSMELQQFKATLYEKCPNIKVLFFDHINKLENINFGGIHDPFQRMNTYIDFMAEDLCKDFYGRMIMVTVGVQINRRKHEEAMKKVAEGKPPYSNDCWAGVNAVERSAYYALVVFSNYETWRENEIIVQSLKHRIGRVTEGAIYVPAYPEKLIIGDDVFGEVSGDDDDDSGPTYVDEILGDSDYMDVEYLNVD